MTVTINGSAIFQPSSAIDSNDYAATDRKSISKRPLRNRAKRKRNAELEWDALAEADFIQLVELFQAGNAVQYSNDFSSYGLPVSFVGLPDVDEEGDYQRPYGRRALKVTIRES